MDLDNVRPGDLLYRTKGIVEHAGIYLGNKQVFHNSPDNDVEVVSFEQYAAGKEVKVIHKSVDDVALLAKQLELIIAGSKNTQ
ncbi:NlpC/P60 family protein [Marinomonas fungiae]|uniref:NlpC/P60 family protein n=1 Tax=Marinomonas fungiae TaxID=1137284 RepID=UPI003A95625E